MKNADMPAAPTTIPSRTIGGGVMPPPQNMPGLTKREMMAAHAPEMPEWFEHKWCMEFANNDRYFKSDVDEYGCAVREITAVGQHAMYFAWRSYCADALLAELER